MRSPIVPAIGILVLWTLFACFSILRHEGPRPTSTRPSDARSAAAVEVAEDPPETEPPHAEDPLTVPVGTEVAALGTEEPEGLAEPETESALTPGDRELLDLLEGGAGSDIDALLARLRTFVGEHPDHLLARAMLTLFLVPRDDADPAELRSHVEALQILAPEKGLPDVLRALLEAREGSRERAEGLLSLAVRKDLDWLPDFEVARLAIQRELEKGAVNLEILGKAFSVYAPVCMALRGLTREFLPPLEEAEGSPPRTEEELRSRSQVARSILELGRGIQETPGFMIHHLVGAAIVEVALGEIEKGGKLTPEERALRERPKDLQSVASLLSDRIDQILFARPELVPSYLRGIVEHGEATAARRTLMDYLAGDLAR